MGRAETARHLSLLSEGWGDPEKDDAPSASRRGANPAAWLPGRHLLTHLPETSQRNACLPSDALLPGFPLPRIPHSLLPFIFKAVNGSLVV